MQSKQESVAESKKRALETIDAQIRSFEHTIAYLKKKRNELAPVSSLPAELLSMIFHFSVSKNAYPPQCNTLATFSWSTISTSLPTKWQTAFLERSRHAPLLVSMINYNPKSPQINAMLSQTARIRRMTFDGDATTVNDVVAALASPAPLLEALKISLLNSWPFSSLEQGVVLAHNPQHLQAPLLQRVDFTNCTLPLSSSVFRTITSVKIAFEDCSPPFTSSELYEGLKAIAPRLQELELHFDIDLKADGVLYDPIPLPKLEKLALSNSGENSMGLLHFLHLPTSAHLDLKCESPDIEDIESMCSDIANSWVSTPLSKPRHPPSLQRLSISYDYDGGLKIFGWNRYADGSNASKGRMLAIHSIANHAYLNTIISIILRSLPVRNLPALELKGEWTNAANLQQVLVKMPSLREIKFSGDISSIDTFSSILVEDANGVSSASLSTAAPTLPSLQVITLEHLPFGEVVALIERLSRALAGRSAKGTSSIQNIILKKCGPIDEDALNQLKDFKVTGVKNVIRIG